ncbi:transketolase [Caldimonas sp. KR1-144]|uniref:transketolase n=1 Tax=Caldimonas sp. KR1-144 TaxID=3400911 RepID=UPI003C024F20
MSEVDPRTLADALRFLAIDAVDAANSGHPGMPMGMADIAEVLWREHLKHDPQRPDWPDRDRFVLSNGHGSMLLYALLHLTGYALPLDELKRFRQLGSRTPGHPEVGHTAGVETTTGPLGQGLANAVGMALAEKLLAHRFNQPGHEIVDHRTWVFLGDGCLMEGISHEAASLAGVWELGKLCCFYDDNGISIDGHVDGWFRDDTRARFEAYGWRVIGPIDGHDRAQIEAAIRTARSSIARPTLVICRTTIGWGSPAKAGTHDVHGAPLGQKESLATREALGWPHAAFEIPAPIRAAWDARDRGREASRAWDARLASYSLAHPALADELLRRLRGALPADWAQIAARTIDAARAVEAPTATRKSSQNALEALVPALPELLGGSADLTGSNLTAVKASVPVDAHGVGNHVHYGVREFGMAAAMNGIALHGGLLPYGGTFAVFSDYSRNAIRMAALMQLPVVHVLTHDSIGLGEDGPTHQPVEHAATLRLIPGLDVWRPADAMETAVAWTASLARACSAEPGPSALLLSRQNLPQLARAALDEEAIARGGYVVADAVGRPDVVLIGTGSELQLALAARTQLAEQGIAARVVSMPSTSVFDRQSSGWRDAVLPRGVPRVAVEAAHPDFWRKYVGLEGEVVGMARFGESAPATQLYQRFGITAEAVVAAARRVAGRESVQAEPAYAGAK